MAIIDVDTVKLRECGNDIMSLTSELNEVINSLYTRISNMPSTTLEWTGEAANEFVRKANKEKKYYIDFKNNLYEYGRLLSNTADKIDNSIRKMKTDD